MLLTVGDIAKEVRVTKGTVRKWIREGKLRKLPLPGIIRVEEEELKRFLKGGETER